MKKQVSAILAASMAASMLVACGGSTSSAATSTATAESTSTASSEAAPAESTADAGQAADITLWTYPIGKWGDSESVDALLADFNAQYPDIHVTVEYLDYTNGDDQVNTAIEGGSAPDIVMEGPERLVANWGAKGLMADLSDLWTDDQKADISASVEAACKDSSGAYYEFPLCMTAHCIGGNGQLLVQHDAQHQCKDGDDGAADDNRAGADLAEGISPGVDHAEGKADSTGNGGQKRQDQTCALFIRRTHGLHSFTASWICGHSAHTWRRPVRSGRQRRPARQRGRCHTRCAR